MFTAILNWVKTRRMHSRLNAGCRQLHDGRLWHAEQALRCGLELGQQLRNPYATIKALFALAGVERLRGCEERCMRFAQMAMFVANEAFPVGEEFRQSVFERGGRIIDTLMGKEVNRRLRIVRLARAIVDGIPEASQANTGAGKVFEDCKRLVAERLGHPHWLTAVILCAEAEERIRECDFAGASRLRKRASLIASEFRASNKGARAVASLTTELGWNG